MPTFPVNTKTFTGSTLVPPDGYVLTYSSADGYYIPKPNTKILLNSSPASSPYTATNEDSVLVQTHSGTFTVNLPVGPIPGTNLYIKDFAGVAAANPINIVSAALIDGASPYTINTNYGAIHVVFNGATWSILSKF